MHWQGKREGEKEGKTGDERERESRERERGERRKEKRKSDRGRVCMSERHRERVTSLTEMNWWDNLDV